MSGFKLGPSDGFLSGIVEGTNRRLVPGPGVPCASSLSTRFEKASRNRTTSPGQFREILSGVPGDV
jgi:hypothetical protein